MKTIQLTKGASTIVDDDMFVMLNRRRWHLHDGGYATRWERFSDGSKKKIFMHRIVALAREGEDVHHIDEDGLNNQRANLKVLPHGPHRRHHLSREAARAGQYRGVHWDAKAGKWMAQIRATGKKRYLGYFDTAEEAARAWDKAARLHFGPGCYQNFPDH